MQAPTPMNPATATTTNGIPWRATWRGVSLAAPGRIGPSGMDVDREGGSWVIDSGIGRISLVRFRAGQEDEQREHPDAPEQAARRRMDSAR